MLLEEGTVPLSRSPSSAKLRSNKIRIEVARGPDAGVVVELPGPDARVGTGKDCDLVLHDPAVSREHLRLRIENEAIRVLDAGSRNGTTVDGVEVRDAFARPDSSIVVGTTTLRLRMLSDVVELPIYPEDRFGHLLGQSVAMRRVFALLARVAPTDDTVLIEGETGTGKELVAQSLHDASRRAAGPFVVFDCSAVTATLIEAELFGHAKGAFSGAIADHGGRFEEAHGGTLFLDEIGELPIELQPKLLRALESREVRRVGGGKPRRVDVRIIAATNRSLAREVDRGRFREDLYYRLAVIPVRLPPLRERPEDIPLLVRHLERERSNRANPGGPLPDAVVSAFAAQSWPGNVRELRNAVDRAFSLGPPDIWFGGAAPQADLPPGVEVSLDVPLLIGRERLADAYEKAYLEEALLKTGGNVSRAAEIARVGRRFAQKAMRRHGLRAGDDE